jgi:hypothetical protein
MRARALVSLSLFGLLFTLLLSATRASSLPLHAPSSAALDAQFSDFQPTGWVVDPLTTASIKAYNASGLMPLGRYKVSTDGGATWSAESDQGLTVDLDGPGKTAFMTVTNLSLPESLTQNQNQIMFCVWTLPLQIQECSAGNWVRVDINPPQSTVNTTGCYASAWPGEIRGTASDAASGVSSVELRLRRNSDSWYYNGSSWQAAAVWLAASGTTSWSYPFTLAEDSYFVQSRATDAVGRQQTAFGQGTFSSDETAPLSAIATVGYFSNSTWTGAIQGSASDTPSGVASVEITVRRGSDGRYYDGASWGLASTWLSASGTSAWSYPFTPTVQTSYAVQSRAIDYCDNTQSPPTQRSFTYDATLPQSIVNTSGCISASGWPGAITGSASDVHSAVDYVQITLQRASDGLYFTGSSWSSAPMWLSASGTTAWSYSFTPSVDTTYTVNSRAVDAAGNIESDYGTGSFTYDSTPPTAPFSLSITPSNWTTTNGFTLTWSNPADVCGIAAAHYKWDAAPTSNSDESPGSPVAGQGVNRISGMTVPSQGAHRLYLWLEDAAGNVSYLRRAVTAGDAFKWDATPPQTSIANVVGDQPCAGWYTSAVEVEILAEDAHSGIQSTFWRQDGGSWQQVSASSFVVTGEGSHTVEYYSVDRAGNSETPQVLSPQVKIDTAPPATQEPSYAGSRGQGGWYVSSVSVALTALDATSGVSGTYHQVGSGPFELGNVFQVITDGVHTINYYSVDQACNEEATQTASEALKIDKSHPATTYQLSGLEGENNCFLASPVTVQLAASDTITGAQTSGVAELHYRVHPGSWQQTTSEVITLTVSLLPGQDEAIHTVEYYATDLAGNVEPLNVLPVCIDSKAPEPIRRLPSVVPSGFTNTNCFTITWSLSDLPDDVSGIGGAYYSFAEPLFPTDGISVTGANLTSIPCVQLPATFGDGEHDAYVWLRDRAGNSDHLTYRNVKLRLDQTPPEITSSLTGSQCGTGEWYNSCVTVTFAATDLLSGMAGGVISYHVNSESWVEGSSYTECRDGLHTVEGRAMDAAGNESVVLTASPIKVDRTAPSAPLGIRVEPAVWSGENSFTLSWINPGDLSGLAGVYYKQGNIPLFPTDGISVTGTQSSLSVSADMEGEVPVYVWLIDKACNSDHRNRAMAPVKYDSTPPTTTYTASGSVGGDNWYVSTVQITLQSQDSASGWASSRYRIGSGPWQSGQSFAIDLDGVISFSYYSLDHAGNAEVTRQGSVRIDRIPPQSWAYAESYSQVSSFTVRWDGRDALSGIACFDVQYRIGATGSWQNWVGPCVDPSQDSKLFTGGIPGKCYYFRSRATDAAGNVEPYRSEPDVYVCVDPVQNGGFERALGGEWEQKGLDGQCPPARIFTQGHKGSDTWAVVLGCPDQEEGPVGASLICQTLDVPLPQDMPAPMLHFRYHIFTYDVLWGVTDPDQVYDSFNVGIGPPGVVQPTHVYTDGNRSTSYGQLMDLGWRDGSVDLRSYAGQVVKACLANVTRVDEAYNTWTIVDDVRMVNLEHRLYVPIIVRASPTSGLSQKVHPKPVRSKSGVER